MPQLNPDGLTPYGVKGIFIGGCVERGEGSSFRRRAHAHCRPQFGHLGWICIRSARRLYTLNGGWSRLVWHEVAHIWRRSWTEKQCDTFAWRKVRE